MSVVILTLGAVSVMAKPFDPAKAVNKGAKLLDKKVPGWAKKIKVTKLKLETDTQCVMGQLYDGNPYKGLADIGLIKPEDVAAFCDFHDSIPRPELEKVILNHGFMLDEDTPERAKQYNFLWKEAVKQRKEKS
jgi:hypothetical protein